MAVGELLQVREAGLYCEIGDFYIDPWQPVRKAVVTHAHGDHLAQGSGSYLAAREGESVLRGRLNLGASLDLLPYGEQRTIGAAKVSLHPAGHILGSAQVRVEVRGEVWVVSGDYKLEPDLTCTPFEPVQCDTFISEATFALPIYRWPPQSEVFAAVNAWWIKNQQEGKASLLFAYPLGKAQRLLSGLDSSLGPIFTHGSVERMVVAYRQMGVSLPETRPAVEAGKVDWSKALVLAPVSARTTPWVRRFGNQSTAFASGWMRVRGMRRRQAVDRGFVLSDHADWPGLLQAISASSAQRVLVTHGYIAPLVRWLREHNINADGLTTRFGDEAEQVE